MSGTAGADAVGEDEDVAGTTDGAAPGVASAPAVALGIEDDVLGSTAKGSAVAGAGVVEGPAAGAAVDVAGTSGCTGETGLAVAVAEELSLAFGA